MEAPTPTPKARATPASNQQTVFLSKNQQQPLLRKLPLSVAAQASKDVSPRQENIIDDLLIEDSVVKGGDDVTTDKVAMSMSKKELLDEMRKEKHQHHRQIRYIIVLYFISYKTEVFAPKQFQKTISNL